MAKRKAARNTVPGTGVRAVASAQAVQPSRAAIDAWDRIAWYCLHVLVILVPIAMSNLGPLSPGGLPFTYDQFDIAKVFFERGIILVALGAWAIGLLIRGGKVRFSRGEWVLLAFLAWVTLTTVFSVHPPTAVFGKYRRFEGLISFVTYGATFFVALQLVDRAERLRSLARSLAIGGFLVAGYGAVQVVGSVALDVARVLQPLAVIATVLVPLALGYLGWRSADDAEARRAFWVGAVVALGVGVVFAAGLAQNIEVALSGGSQVVALDPVRWGGLPFEPNRAFSTFGNPDLLGGYLIFPFAVTLALALSEKHRLWRVVYWMFTLLNVFVGITSYVRGAWIGATVSLALIIFAYVRARSGTGMRLTRTDTTFIAGAGATAVAVMVASSLRPDAVRNVLTRVISIFQFDQGSALTRFQIWEAARAAVAERPLLGWGADTFRLLFPMFKPAEYVQVAGYLSVADNVHNYPLQLASGIGIPGALLFYGAIAVALFHAARESFAKGTAARNLVLSGLWAAVAGYVVHLMFGLSVTGSTIMMWLVLALLLGPVATEREVKAPSWGTIAALVATGLVVLGLVADVRYVMADNAYLHGRVTTQGVERVEAIERAIALNPYNEMYRLELGSAWQDLFRATAQAYRDSVASGTPDEQARDAAKQTLASAIAAYDYVIDYVPQEYDTYVFFANLYNEAGTYLDPAYFSDAMDIAKAGVVVEPFGPAVRVQLAIAALALDDPKTAIEHLEVATGLDSNYTQAFLRLGEAYRMDGRISDARGVYENVLGRYPDNAEARGALDALDATSTP